MHLDLEPLPGAAFFIRTIAVLGYDSFKPFARCDAISGKAIHRQPARKEELLWWFSERGFQFLPAPYKCFGPEIPAIAIKAVEYRKAQGLIATLKELEAGDTFCIERHDLAVEKNGCVVKLAYRIGDSLKTGSPVEIVAHKQRHFRHPGWEDHAWMKLRQMRTSRL